MKRVLLRVATFPSTCDERRTRAAFNCGAADSSWDERLLPAKKLLVRHRLQRRGVAAWRRRLSLLVRVAVGRSADANDPARDLMHAVLSGDGAVEPLCMPR